ncbi:MAG TPA: hypothetical protein VKS21_10625 [Spirochaetota bacterium]|nr:hypothetical protein [Spirochaetota bacterium]
METYLEQIPENLQEHVKEIAKKTGRENAVEKVAQAWLEKQDIFSKKFSEENFEEVDSLDKDDARGAIAITRSGSILNIGPQESKRNIEYSSIGLRTNVPPAAEANGAVLEDNITIDQPARFDHGPVKSTSDIYKIAVCPENMEAEEQKDTLENMTQSLEQEFAQINETVQSDTE